MSKLWNCLGVLISLAAFSAICIFVFKYSDPMTQPDPDNIAYLFDWHAPLAAFAVLISLYIGGQTFHLVPGGMDAVMTIHAVFVTLGVLSMSIALAFIFQSHAKNNLDDMYSVHAWAGIFFFSVFGVQFLGGVFTFFFPLLPRLLSAPVSFVRAYHKAFGQALIAAGAAAVITGIFDRQRIAQDFMGIPNYDPLARWANVAAVLTFVAAIFTAFSLTLKTPVLSSDEETKPLNPDL